MPPPPAPYRPRRGASPRGTAGALQLHRSPAGCDAMMARVRQRQDVALFPAVRRALCGLVPKRLQKRIVPKASILADLGLDSLKVVELTVLLEKELGRPVF